MRLAKTRQAIRASSGMNNREVFDVRICIIGIGQQLRWPKNTGPSLQSASLPQLLRRHAQGAIEFTGCVFPGNRGRQLYQSIFVKNFPQSREKFVANFAAGYRHGVGKLERKAFHIGKEFAVRVVGESVDFFVGNAELAAHGSVYVLSKLAAVEEGDAPIDEGSQTRID